MNLLIKKGENTVLIGIFNSGFLIFGGDGLYVKNVFEDCNKTNWARIQT